MNLIEKAAAYWMFDEESGVRYDATGNGNDLSPQPTGPVLVQSIANLEASISTATAYRIALYKDLGGGNYSLVPGSLQEAPCVATGDSWSIDIAAALLDSAVGGQQYAFGLSRFIGGVWSAESKTSWFKYWDFEDGEYQISDGPSGFKFVQLDHIVFRSDVNLAAGFPIHADVDVSSWLAFPPSFEAGVNGNAIRIINAPCFVENNAADLDLTLDKSWTIAIRFKWKWPTLDYGNTIFDLLGMWSDDDNYLYIGMTSRHDDGKLVEIFALGYEPYAYYEPEPVDYLDYDIWRWLVIKYNGSKIDLLLDEALLPILSEDFDIGQMGPGIMNHIYFGNPEGSFDNSLHILMDDVGIWIGDNDLTTQELTQLVTQGPYDPVSIQNNFLANAMLLTNYLVFDPTTGCITKSRGCKPLSEMSMAAQPVSSVSMDESPESVLSYDDIPISDLECQIIQ